MATQITQGNDLPISTLLGYQDELGQFTKEGRDFKTGYVQEHVSRNRASRMKTGKPKGIPGLPLSYFLVTDLVI